MKMVYCGYLNKKKAVYNRQMRIREIHPLARLVQNAGA